MRNVLLSLLIICGATSAIAAPDNAISIENESKPKARNILRKKFFQVIAGYQIWHEDVAATSAGTPGDIPMQFHGFEVGGAYQIPMKNFRWVQYYAATLGVGAAKGAGNGPVLDSVKDQQWLAVNVKPGFLYRGTAVSEVGLFVPLTFRTVSWQLDNTAQLELDDKAFSLGLGAQFTNRFTPYSSLLVTVTHQLMWNSTVWGIAYQYDFK